MYVHQLKMFSLLLLLKVNVSMDFPFFFFFFCSSVCQICFLKNRLPKDLLTHLADVISKAEGDSAIGRFCISLGVY